MLTIDATGRNGAAGQWQKLFVIEELDDMRRWRTREQGITGHSTTIQRNFTASGSTWFLRVRQE
ncbi:MAG: hypothetical protein VCA55_00645 [Verrucomicrobiales bacterium]